MLGTQTTLDVNESLLQIKRTNELELYVEAFWFDEFEILLEFLLLLFAKFA